MGPVPEEIDVGVHGLVLRRWRLTDAEPLRAAIEMSQAELRRFMPWAVEPPTPASIRTFLEQVAIDAPAATAIGLALVDAGGQGPSGPLSGGEVVGGFGLTDRRGPGILEIGYWIRSDRTGRGLRHRRRQSDDRGRLRRQSRRGPGRDPL